MDLADLLSDVECSRIDKYLLFIDDNVEKIKAGVRIDVQLVYTMVEAWNLIVDNKDQSPDPTLLKKILLFLRVSCIQGSTVQKEILHHDQTMTSIEKSLAHPDPTVVRSTWQLCSNIVVQCPENVEKATTDLLPVCLTALEENVSVDAKDLDVIAAVIYNLLEANKLLESPIEVQKGGIYKTALRTVYRNHDQQFSYLQFMLEDFLVRDSEPKAIYFALDTEDRIKLHNYTTEYVKSEEKELSSSLLKVLSENFNLLSDRILTWLNGQCATVEPQELLSLLECLCTITGHQNYSLAFKSEASMFINSGALLVACCDSQKNELTPKAKLTDFENNQEQVSDPFYDFKTLLIRLIANLSHKNKKNQDYARDLKILLTVCGCTSLDARNPLMKEWAILAIRNLLENNLENQKLIEQLTRQGQVNSDVLKEYRPENGFMRLSK